MAKDIKSIIRFLFPEYQIKACVDERGFIAKSNKTKNYVTSNNQTYASQGAQNQASSYEKMQVHGGVSFQQPLSQIQQSKAQSNTFTSTKDENKVASKASEVFDELPNEFKKYWIGSEEDRKALAKAFERPYVRGYDNVKPKNSILIIGSESRGKNYAVKCICHILKSKKIFRYAETISMDMGQYGADSSNILFTSDLYKVLNKNTEVVVFENVENMTTAQLDILYQLMAVGCYKLSKRYMVSNGSLVEATGVLNTELVSEITSNGKFFVLTTQVSQNKIISTLGNKIIKEIGDIICLEGISKSQARDLAYTLCTKLATNCKTNLHINVTFDEVVFDEIGKRYSEVSGVKGLEDYINNNIFEPLSEMKLQDKLWDDESVHITYDNDFYVNLKGGEIIKVSQFIKNYNALELEEAKKELNNVIGLKAVKEYVLDLETNFKVQQMREGKGLKKSDISMHMIFAGNPGTGKTTIARIVAKYLKAIGVLSSGHLSEVTRADLVGQYAGHTAVKTTEVINGAKGGVLFIDEAYSLCRDKHDTFGQEAIDALVKGIEDNREDLVVILAGYDDEMQEFLKTNTGLKSRFPNVVHFEDYSVDEMYEIAKITAHSKGYKISSECEEGLKYVFEKSQIKGRNDGGNGRLVRNVIEAAILKQSKRIEQNPSSDLELLDASDFGLYEKKEFDLEKSLSEVIGMDEVKNFIRTQYALLQANKKRKSANINVDTSQSLNMIFVGNPGTGKTTMARIVADMFHSMDILKKGHLVEVDKSGLIASYVGQTAKKTEDVFKSALGGVLFIDEAYSITNDGSSFGQECIDTLVKLIEDYRGEILVILAGYSKEMADFMKANSGLESRFPLKIEFPDYSADELYLIGLRMIAGRGFVLTQEAQSQFKARINTLKRHSNESSGNGRMVRNFVEDIIRRQSFRIALDDVSTKELTTITSEDIQPKKDVNDKFDLEIELSKVIGLESVKRYIRSLNARLKMLEERKKAGLKTDNTQTMHMIFAGNPGTGKTMMARTVANVLYNMNAIRTNKLVETDRSGLVAGYVGQTAIKTRQVIETALDGVLFIDEAYALAQGGENDFGQEAIDTLVKMMDDNRDRLVVILAGYSEDMQRFLQKNAGLQSRFANIIEFPDYSTEELLQIADGLYSEQGYVLSDSAKKVLSEKIEAAKESKQFGNGRYVRNIYERSLNNQALRLSTTGNYTKEALTTITDQDIKEA
ncbi:AAA family ATPase [Ruminiclostridium herbifermentans]|uniref:AAA family ATPase n=1 Tax=Ruminiclostridium herbifermentans TaxID=2488810 RepID=A0A4U7JCS0_9FIRM|nr:AAA family ATPase [Ruminiclostridium herbifermentans]QNU65894.1 AAA family ATPase [Ruminiclostridium herbifermentans]